MLLSHGESTATGHRANNQDAMVAVPHMGMFAVADGVGGNTGGALASRLAVAAMREMAELGANAPGMDSLAAGFWRARQSIRDCSVGKYSQMATTLVALQIQGSLARIGHVGDSRAYRRRGGRIEQMTVDHSLAMEWQRAVGSDIAVPRRVAATLTRAIAGRFDPTPEVLEVELEPGDVFLLCTDGVSGPLDMRWIERCLELDPEDAAEMCVRMALHAGGRDNATAMVVRV